MKIKTVEALEQLVHLAEFALADAADLLDRTDVTLVELRDGLGHVLSGVGQADADRAAVDARTLVVDEAEVDQLLDVVGDVRAEIVAARAQFAGGQFGVADVEEEQRLDGVDVRAARPVELVLDHVEQATVQAFDEVEGFQIEIADRIFLRIDCDGLRLHLGVHVTASLFCLAVLVCFPALSETLSNASKILLKPQA